MITYNEAMFLLKLGDRIKRTWWDFTVRLTNDGPMKQIGERLIPWKEDEEDCNAVDWEVEERLWRKTRAERRMRTPSTGSPVKGALSEFGRQNLPSCFSRQNPLPLRRVVRDGRNVVVTGRSVVCTGLRPTE